MPAIFVSHSTLDKKFSQDIRSWLGKLGFDRVFLDFDKDTGFGAGVLWEKQLHDEIARCHAVLLVLSPNWLASKWCFAELQQARALGKIILPVLCAPIGDQKVLPEVQGVDIVDWNEDGLKRIEQRLFSITNDLARGFTLPVNRPPYPGIYAFEMEDAAIYFGRDEETRAVIEKLDARRTQGGARLVLIIGASGAGKSSLLKAGVLPQLWRRRGHWLVLPPIRPEKAPLEALAKAISHHLGKAEAWEQWHHGLKGPQALRKIEKFLKHVRIGDHSLATVLLPIDQFEEVFSIAEAGEREAFLGLLAAMFDPARGLPVLAVATGRVDVLQGLLEVSVLALLTDTVPLLPMSPASVPRVIEGPAEVAGLAVDRDVTAAIVRDIENAEALPLLAQMLHLLHARCVGDKRFTLVAYLALGDPSRKLNPVQNSVRLAADEAMQGLNPSAQELAALREAFVPHLVRLRLDDRKLVRQPTPLRALPRGAERLIRALTQARLLTVRSDGDDALVEVTHEALFAGWPRLSRWLDEEQDFLADIERLKGAHETWQKAPVADKPKALLSGLLLARARHWLIRHPQRFVGSNMEPLRVFIADSAGAADAAEARAARLNRRLFQAVTAVAVILAAAVAVTGFLYYQAEIARAVANAQRQIAVARQILAVSQAEAGSNTECSLYLAVSAYDAAKLVPELELLPFETAVRTELAHSRVIATVAGKLSKYAMSWRPDGTALAFADFSGAVWQWTEEQGATPQAIDGIAGVIGIEWTPNGKELLLSTSDSIKLWDVNERKITKSIRVNGNDLHGFRWNKDGKRVVAHSDEKGTFVIDIDAETTVRIGPADNVWRGHSWSSDGQRVVIGVGTEAWIVNVDERSVVRLEHPENLGDVAWSPDGKWIAVGLDGGQIWIWDAANHTHQQTIGGHSNQVRRLEFSPDGSQLISASWDHSLVVWDVASWLSKDKLTGHSSAVTDVRWSPSGRTLATAALDGTLRVWSPNESRTPLTWLRTPGWVWNVGWSGDQKILAAAADHEVAFRNEAGELRRVAEIKDQIHDGSWSASGDTYAFPKQGGEFSVVKASTGETIVTKDVHMRPLMRAALSSDASMIAVTSLAGIQVLSLPGGNVLQSIQATALAVAFAPVGKRLAYASSVAGTIKILNLATGEAERPLSGMAPGTHTWGLAWSHDGLRLAAGSDDDIVRAWDLSRPDQPTLFRGHSAEVKSVAWDSTDKQLATGALDETVRVWDVSSGRTLAILTGHVSGVRSVAWNKDSTFIATGGEDGTARIFYAIFDQVLAVARQQTTVGLTAPEREQCQRRIAPNTP
jgi:WD40 repeat protein